MSSPDLSVVMSVYNNADTLPAVMESVLSQQGVAFEFVIIDDGSTDGSAAILDDCARRDPRAVVEHQSNQGLTRALVRGCELAKAPWIVRQDADDLSLPGRLAALWRLAQSHPDAAMLGSSSRFVGPEGEPLCDMLCTPDPDLARRQVRDLGIGPPGHGTVMFSRAVYQSVGGYRACFYFGQDSDLWMRLAEAGPVAYTPEILYSCRLNPHAISGSERKRQKAFARLARQCRDARGAGRSEEPFLREAEALCREVRAHRSRPASRSSRWLSYYHIGSLLERTDRRKAARYFRHAIACNPFAWRAWVKLLASAVPATRRDPAI